MSKLRFDVSVSADGYMAGANQTVDNPLGEGGEALHDWFVELEIFRTVHGETGGVRNASTPLVEESIANVGAGIMGRNMFGGGPGPWGENPWRGWWGEDPPFHHELFVLTHHARPTLTLSDTRFTFVTDGIHAAYERAKAAAGGKDIKIHGGAHVIRQYLAAGLVDEFELHVAPLTLGAGERPLDVPDLKLERLRVVEAPGVTHVKYRVLK